MPHTPFRSSRHLRLLVLLVWLAGLSGPAFAATFTIEFEGTVTGATLELDALLSGGETVTGSVVLDDSVAGVFTPAGDPTFVRHEMLYAGAVVSAEVTLLGDTVSGAGGDAELFDATAMLAGSDSYETTGSLDMGTIAGVVPASIFLALEHPFTGFSVSGGDPLAPPPPFDATTFNLFTLTADSGAIAFGSVVSYDVVAVPEPAALPLLLTGLGAASLVRRCARRRSRAA